MRDEGMTMQLCVGAVSRRVIEEAAALQVYQIVASRRQVDTGGGYTGLDQEQLVNLVNNMSGGVTKVIRDHGGPRQGGTEDTGVDSLNADCDAGFDGIHIDVCQLPMEDQGEALRSLLERFRDQPVQIEVGGEHDSQSHNRYLLDIALDIDVLPSHLVVGFESRVWADQQYGTPISPDALRAITHELHDLGVSSKIHNADWIGDRVEVYGNAVDAYNIAPEFGTVEIDALLTVLNASTGHTLLDDAYDGGAWRRWFNVNEGTWLTRAKCALRYRLAELDNDYVRISTDADLFIRRCIRDAIRRG